MTNKEFNGLMLKLVSTTLNSQSDEMIQQLCKGISTEDSSDERNVKMISNAVYYSVAQSVECILSVLEEIGIINPQNIQTSPETLSALNLRLLK